MECRRPGFNPWFWKVPWRRKWRPTLLILPGKSHGQRSLAGYSPWGREESDTTEHARTSTHTHIHTRARARQVDEVWPQDVDWVQVWSILSHLPGNKGLPGGSGGKVSTCNAGDLGSIPGSGRSPGDGNGNPLQYSCLENPMDRGV